MSIAIRVEHLSKQYRLGALGTGSFSHDINRWWHRARGKVDPYLKLSEVNNHDATSINPYVWALQDISFDVRKGEVLGIIGGNGAGKSTLLKILSQVTAPTEGGFKARGKMASLLEVGTGFHRELTGRENIFLNGAILGMTRSEIRAKFDEIIAFSGVERYVDTPVKRYSSGMIVRLAFAVAAHLEAEILIVDEVLAVGDAAFQKKAIGKMQEVSRGYGRTILFVSHNMGATTHLCQRGIVLKKGNVHFEGDIEQAVRTYADINVSASHTQIANRTDRTGLGEFQFKEVYLEDEQHRVVQEVKTGVYVCIRTLIVARTTTALPRRAYALVRICDALGAPLFTLSTAYFGKQVTLREETVLTFEVKRLPLVAGEYTGELHIAEGLGGSLVQDYLTRAFTLTVYGNDYFHRGVMQSADSNRFFVDFKVFENTIPIISA